MKLRFFRTALTGGLLALSIANAHAETIRIGVVPGAYADSITVAAKEAAAQGLDVKTVEFTDWTTPNVALASGDIQVNYFQHKPFLQKAIEARGYKFVAIDTGILSNIGLYSLKHKSLSEIPQNGKVAIANDPVNQGRGLLLLEKAGLIKLKPGVGYLGSLKDIVQNPKNLSFVEVEGPQLTRVTPDVDLAMGYPHFIVAAKAFDPSSGLVYSGIEDERFAIQFVVNEKDANNADIRRFIRIYQNSPAVKAAIRRAFANDDRLYTFAWLKQPGAKVAQTANAH
jgi:D-methionine transport system substrate-binding protein